jgi:hypothetical protein
MSGFGIYGDSHTTAEENDVHDNGQNGFEIAENANGHVKIT